MLLLSFLCKLFIAGTSSACRTMAEKRTLDHIVVALNYEEKLTMEAFMHVANAIRILTYMWHCMNICLLPYVAFILTKHFFLKIPIETWRETEVKLSVNEGIIRFFYICWARLGNHGYAKTNSLPLICYSQKKSSWTTHHSHCIVGLALQFTNVIVSSEGLPETSFKLWFYWTYYYSSFCIEQLTTTDHEYQQKVNALKPIHVIGSLYPESELLLTEVKYIISFSLYIVVF